MKFATLALCLVAVSLSAAETHPIELGLSFGKQASEKVMVGDSSIVATAKDTLAIGLRVGYTFFASEPVGLQLNVAHQFSATGDLTRNDKTYEGASLSHEATSVGAAAVFYPSARINVNLGMDLRMEKLRCALPDLGAKDVATTRPWFRAASTYNFALGGMKPFVGAEVSAPLARFRTTATGQDSIDTQNDAFILSMAPRLQFGLIGGVRF